MTDIIDAANDPIVDSLATLTDNVLDIETAVSPVPLVGSIFGPGDTLNITDVDVEIDDILSNIAAGNNIGLTVLDTDGNAVAPGDCNVTADGFALNTEGGIAIGGNQITGLGDGLAASAGELDAIAFGNGASTSVGADGAVALGTDATVTAANSVALGAGSVADRGAQTGYTAAFLPGTFDSAGTVSVGAPGALRQITNVAPGTDANDAATVGQVQAAIDSVTASGVQYDDATQTSVTLAGAGGTTITNLADGAVTAGSRDAVNGSQLFATNEAVADNADDIADLQDDSVMYDDDTHDTVTLDGAGGTTLTNVAPGTVAAGSTDAVNGAQLFATNQAIAALGGGGGGGSGLAVTYDDATLDTVSLGGAGGTTVTNVADGALSAASREAVNGSQLFSTNEAVDDIDDRVTVNEGDITALDGRVTVNEGDIATLEDRVDNIPVGYVDDADPTMASTVPTDTAAFFGASAGSVRVTNVAAGTLGAGSTDAVNGAQLGATNDAVANNTTNIAQNRTDIDQNTADITTINNNLAGSTVVAVQYSDPDTPTQSNGGTITNDVTLVGADSDAPIRVHNVAAGVAATDAVNVGQFQAGMADVLADSMTYTDERFGVLSDGIAALAFDLEELRDDAFAGTASAMAVSGIPQTMEPGKSMFGGAVGHYRGETAFAIGFSTSFSDGQGVVKGGATLDTHGKGGFSAGAGFSF